MPITLLTFDPARDLKCWADHVSLEPGAEPEEALCIARRYERSMKPACYVVPLDNLFKFCQPESRVEEEDLIASCFNMAQILECPTEKNALIKLSMYVQDNIDKVLKLAPYSGEGHTVGEVEGKFNGESFTSQVKAY